MRAAAAVSLAAARAATAKVRRRCLTRSGRSGRRSARFAAGTTPPVAAAAAAGCTASSSSRTLGASLARPATATFLPWAATTRGRTLCCCSTWPGSSTRRTGWGCARCGARCAGRTPTRARREATCSSPRASRASRARTSCAWLCAGRRAAGVAVAAMAVAMAPLGTLVIGSGLASWPMLGLASSGSSRGTRRARSGLRQTTLRSSPPSPHSEEEEERKAEARRTLRLRHYPSSSSSAARR
mmetsp:Transcript_10907/g.34718  ORF Transcript_10907/g.34718 Transcript_10907/m.34718 type:complete len:241 (+) Transcript_10907:419-1141(+)